MISYLGIGFSCQAIIDYNIPDLFHLIGFAFAGMRLQVENLGNAISKEYMVAAFDTLLKPKALQKLHHTGKRDICVSIASQNLVEKFVRARHVENEC